jgi:hypothetical protein
MSSAPNYEVGFGKPPKATQFVKGQSGNPNGRPKGSFNLSTLLEKALQERVVVQEHGQKRSISKLEVMVKQVVNKAAGGDQRAFQQVIALMARSLEPDSSEAAQPSTDQDRQIVQNLFRRMQAQLHQETHPGGPEGGFHER